MARIYIGLGSNLGDRAGHLAFAKQHFHVVRESKIYESPALLSENAAADWNRPYLNQVIEIETSLDPLALLAELKRVEQLAGRKDRGRWAPRELDLDLLAYGDERLSGDRLTIPHQGIAQRDFVLLPLKDIAPDYPHINEWIHDLPSVQARVWREQTHIVGILNITPDSFSDGGLITPEAVLKKFEQLVQDGASVIDIGAESTRPDAVPLSASEERQRLEKPLAAIMAHPMRSRVLISVDTRHAETARRVIALGADWINDVSGLRDEAMVAVLKDALCDVVMMHALTIPADRNVKLPDSADPIAEIIEWKRSVSQKGIAEHRLIYDPGIGFGKTAAQSLALIERAHELVATGGRWLFGHSRKSFMQIPLEERDSLTLHYSRLLAAKDIHYLRVHAVGLHARLLETAIEESVGVSGIKLTLERVQYVLDKLGNPELRLPPVIHIAGTNGKGSTLAYLRSIYEAAGKKVHSYSSPHLVRYNERIVLAGKEVGDAQLIDAILRVRAQETEAYPITVFERITAAAYLCFSEVAADVLLLETGMGGRFDTTNVTPKIATVITPIGYDHMEFLGDSLAAIAGEKAAIMRANVPCIVAPQEKEAEAVITRHAESIQAPLYWAKLDNKLSPALSGHHQQWNASVAAETARVLGISEDAIRAGVANAHWPARLQHLLYGPLVNAWRERGDVWLDGGHNAHAAVALVEWIKSQQQPVYLLCGMMRRKNAREWMENLAPYVAGMLCISLADGGAYASTELADLAREVGVAHVEVASDWQDAERKLRAYPVSLAHLLLAGSLYLAGDALKNHG